MCPLVSNLRLGNEYLKVPPPSPLALLLGLEAPGHLFFQIAGQALQVAAFLDGAGIAPAPAQGLLLLAAEFLRTGGKILPDKQLLQDVALRRGKIPLRVEGFTSFGGIDHMWLLSPTAPGWVNYMASRGGNQRWRLSFNIRPRCLAMQSSRLKKAWFESRVASKWISFLEGDPDVRPR